MLLLVVLFLLLVRKMNELTLHIIIVCKIEK